MCVNNANLESPNNTNATGALYKKAIHFDIKTNRRSCCSTAHKMMSMRFMTKNYEKGLHRVKLS